MKNCRESFGWKTSLAALYILIIIDGKWLVDFLLSIATDDASCLNFFIFVVIFYTSTSVHIFPPVLWGSSTTLKHHQPLLHNRSWLLEQFIKLDELVVLSFRMNDLLGGVSGLCDLPPGGEFELATRLFMLLFQMFVQFTCLKYSLA